MYPNMGKLVSSTKFDYEMTSSSHNATYVFACCLLRSINVSFSNVSDKCFCGIFSSDVGDGAKCVYHGDTPDDDTVTFSCRDRSKFKFQGYSWTVPS